MSIIKSKKMKIPTHLAIILDGNGRWALKKGLSRSIGHKVGAKTMKEIISYCFSLNVKFLSLYCFSIDNIKREKKEVDYLLSLPEQYFNRYLNDLIKDDIKVIISGDISIIPKNSKKACEKVIEKTKDCKTHTLNICLNYGSQEEIVQTCINICKDVKEEKIDINSIDKSLFESYLYSKELPSIDLLIRTSNEKRLSNFMLYQMSYAELYFTKTLWPAFSKKDLQKAFIEFNKRKRRFGGV